LLGGLADLLLGFWYGSHDDGQRRVCPDQEVKVEPLAGRDVCNPLVPEPDVLMHDVPRRRKRRKQRRRTTNWSGGPPNQEINRPAESVSNWGVWHLFKKEAGDMEAPKQGRRAKAKRLTAFKDRGPVGAPAVADGEAGE